MIALLAQTAAAHSDAGNVAGIVGGAVTVLGLLGAGVRWLMREHVTRETRLDEREGKYVDGLEARLGLLEKTVGDQAEKLHRHALAISILMAKVAREDPSAPELRQVAAILGKAFGLDPYTPADMAATLNKLDGKD